MAEFTEPAARNSGKAVLRDDAHTPQSLPPPDAQLNRPPWSWVALPLVAFVVSRLIYYFYLGVRFDIEPIFFYVQIVDPQLLYTRLLESIYYLRDQPPLFNLLLGVVLKLAPNYSIVIFHVTYLALGLVTTVFLFRLLAVMGAPAALAAILAAGWAIHPTTILYENLLTYEYPVTAALLAAAFYLHRALLRSRTPDAAAFATLLALIALMRGTFHLAWLIAILAGFVLLSPQRRRTVRAVAIPACLVFAVYLKHFALYGDPVFGEIYQKANLAVMTTSYLPPEAIADMKSRGELSPLITPPSYEFSFEACRAFLPPLPETGIPMLDRVQKSSGAPNWQHHAMHEIAQLGARDAANAFRRSPGAYWLAVRDNCRTYVLPGGSVYPFTLDQYPNAVRLRPPLRIFDAVLAGRFADKSVGWLLVVGLPAAMIIGSVFCWKWWRRWRARRRNQSNCEDRALFGTGLFCLGNILYVAVTTILLSYGDQNRYRFPIMPFYLVFVAVAVGAAIRAIQPLRSRQLIEETNC